MCMRARLAASEAPDRVFEVTLAAAREAGMVGRRRVLDSTALFDAVATMDTVTLIRSAIRGLLAACDRDLEAVLRAVLARDDDYASAGKPVCDYEDRQAREEMIDALAKDARALRNSCPSIRRAQGMPGASRAPTASYAKVESIRVSHRRRRKRSGIPCTMVLRLISRSPR